MARITPSFLDGKTVLYERLGGPDLDAFMFPFKGSAPMTLSSSGLLIK